VERSVLEPERKERETRREKLTSSVSFFVVVSKAVFEVGASGLLIVILGCFLSRFLFLKITQLQRERLKPPGLSPAETKSEEVSWKRRSQDIYVISQSFALIRRDWQASRE
jgi:hypothetical protein